MSIFKLVTVDRRIAIESNNHELTFISSANESITAYEALK